MSRKFKGKRGLNHARMDELNAQNRKTKREKLGDAGGPSSLFLGFTLRVRKNNPHQLKARKGTKGQKNQKAIDNSIKGL